MELSDKNFTWLNPPPSYALKDGELRVTTGNETDFWRETFYDFWRDSGHFFWHRIEGDFTAEVNISGEFEVLYDQAGLMIRLCETHWIKAGVEYTDGRMHFSAVVTNDTSDWSQLEITPDPEGIRIRLTRQKETIRIHYFVPGEQVWKSARLAYFPISGTVDVGLMCCSPQRSGFEAVFRDYTIGPAISRNLHD